MARRGKRRGKKGKKDKAIPVAVAIPAIWVGYNRIYVPIANKNWDSLKQMWTGLTPDGSFVFSSVKATYGPLLVGVVASKAASKLGLQKYIKKATMGYLKV